MNTSCTYDKPRCSGCDAELVLIEEFVHSYVRDITTEGHVGRKLKLGFTLQRRESLRCKSCGSQYKTKFDRSSRVHRGRKFARV